MRLRHQQEYEQLLLLAARRGRCRRQSRRPADQLAAPAS